MSKPIVIRVAIDRTSSGLYRATSRDLPGFLLTNRDVAELKRATPGVLAMMLEHIFSGAVTMVSAKAGLTPDLDDEPMWIAMPPHVASRAMATG